MKCFRWIVYFLFIVLLGGTVYFGYDFVKNSRTTTYDNTKVIKAIEKIQIKCIKSTENKNSKISESNTTIPLISEKDLEVLLKTVAYDARKEAAEEYKNNFNTLLTILTIFGIALPLIIALVNFTINEHQMAKVDEASDKATEASDKATEASNKAEENNKETEDLQIDSYVKSSFFLGTHAKIFRSNLEPHGAFHCLFLACEECLNAFSLMGNDSKLRYHFLSQIYGHCKEIILILGDSMEFGFFSKDDIIKAKNKINILQNNSTKIPDDIEAKYKENGKEITISKQTIIDKLNEIITELNRLQKMREKPQDEK